MQPELKTQHPKICLFAITSSSLFLSEIQHLWFIYKSTRVQEYNNKRVQEYKTTRLQEYKSTRAQEYRVQEYKSTRVQEYKSTKVQEYKSTRKQEYKSTRVQEYKIIRVQEYKRSSLIQGYNSTIVQEYTSTRVKKNKSIRVQNRVCLNPLEYRLKTLKAPRWKIWVRDLKLGLKYMFWTWRVTKILTPKKKFHKKKPEPKFFFVWTPPNSKTKSTGVQEWEYKITIVQEYKSKGVQN